MEAVFLEQLVGQQIDGCQLEQLLSYGEVYAAYRARQLPSKQSMTFTLLSFPKEMSTQMRQRFWTQFLQEAPALVEMCHTHLVSLCGYGEWKGLPYLVMPFLPTESLATILGRQEAYAPAEILTVLEQITAGLEYAHCRGIIHGALTLSHVRVSQNQQIEIAGMGLLHLLQRYNMLSLTVAREHTAALAGLWSINPRYLAPECVQQGRVADIRSDVYSVGLILSDLLAGMLPSEGVPSGEIAREQGWCVLSLPGQAQEVPLPRSLAGVLQQALVAEPGKRFQRISDLLAAFAEGFAESERALASSQQASSLLPTAGTAHLEGSTLLTTRPRELSHAPASLDASRLKSWQQPQRHRSRRHHARGPRTRHISRRHMLARFARGAALGAFGASGISIAYLTSKTLLKLSSSQASGKGPLLPSSNTAQIFTNPRNGREGLLIRLPTGAVVAYDRACTHVGVYVSYDSKSHMLVCPAHGAIFDPAHGGRVVQGPATVPLPQVSIHMKSDGTLFISESGKAPFSNS